MLSLPLKTHYLEAFLPHRSPMIWISEVLTVSEKGGSCRAVWPNAQLSGGNTELQQTILIEWMAQSFAFLTAYKQTSDNSNTNKLSKAFLVGLTDLYLRPVSDHALTLDAIVTIELKHVVPPFSIFSANVMIQNIEYGRGTFKVFGE